MESLNNGILVIDKPAGVNSARVVGTVKRLFPRGTKVGHAGTLDRFATGVLLLLIGRATKQCETLMGQRKTYEATVKLGATTETDDPESPEIPYAIPGQSAAICPGIDDVRTALAKFVGSIEQRPPNYSALKIGGKRASDRIRAGETLELKPRMIQIYSIDLLDYVYPRVTLRIDCGRGTYVRSIARDLGKALGTGGYLTQLRRTRIGEFDITKSVTLETLQQSSVEQHLITLSAS